MVTLLFPGWFGLSTGCDVPDPMNLGDASSPPDLAGFSPPEASVISADPLSAAEADAVLAVGEDGTITAAWMSLRGNSTIAGGRSLDRGKTFSPLGSIPLPSGQAVDPSIAIDTRGRCHLAYQVEVAGERSIWQVGIEGSGAAAPFGVPVQVSAGTSMRRDAPWITALSDGALVVVYSERHPEDASATSLGDRIVLARSEDDGATWRRGDVLGSSGEIPLVVEDARGGLLIATSDPMRQVRYHYSPDGGRSFLPPAAPLGQARTEARPSAIAVGDEILIVFARAERAAIALISLSGGTITAQQDLVADEGFAGVHLPLVSARATGQVHVGFYGTFDGSRGRWRVLVSDESRRLFSRSVALSSADLAYTQDRGWPDWLGDYQAFASLGDTKLSAWTDNRDGAARVYFTSGVP